MPSQINRVPFGFLNVIDSQNFGRNPSQLADQVVPNVDMYPFYAMDPTFVGFATSTLASVGAALTLAVPQNEAWEIVSMSASATASADATATLRWKLGLDMPRFDGAGVARAFFAQGPDTQPVLNGASAARNINLTWVAPQRLIVRPGTICVAQVCDMLLGGLASFSCGLQVLHRRWRIS